MIQGIHHVSAFIKDFKTSHHFYHDILGYRLVKNTVNQENLHMRHLFYGDYEGTPGTILTYFEIPRIGHTYNGAAYFGRITLAVPKSSLSFWKERFDRFEVAAEFDQDGLLFADPDGMEFRLLEVDEVIDPGKATRHSEIPAPKQIIQILMANFCVNTPLETEKWLRELGFQGKDGLLGNDGAGSYTQVYPSFLTKKTRFGRGTIDHIAYSLKTKEDVDLLFELAQKLGLEIEEFVDRGYFKSLYLRDPAGLRVEFASMEPGFTLDEQIEDLGETFSLPPFLENKRAEIEAYFGGNL